MDVFLKQTRLVKRRSLAKELCDEGVVEINGHPTRAGRAVASGDVLVLKLRNRRLEVEVLGIPARAPGTASAADYYRVISDERIEHGQDS